MRNLGFIVAALFGAAWGSAFGQEMPPDDPVIKVVLEEDVRAVSETLRCVVCKNQSIADSDAGLAKDMVNLVRERLENGDTPDEARAYIVDRYGEFVLLKPTFSSHNFFLWFGPLLVLGLAGAGALAFILSKRRVPAAPVGLTDEERSELAKRLEAGGLAPAVQGGEKAPE